MAQAHDNQLHVGQALLSLGRALTSAHPDGRQALAEARAVFTRLRADAWLDAVDRLPERDKGTSH